MVTDGDLPVVDLRRVEAPAPARDAQVTDIRDNRPAAIAFSAGVTWLRAVVAFVLAGSLLVIPEASAALTGTSTSTAALAGAAVLALVATVDVGLGIATYLGRNWARVLLMASSATTILVAFVVTANGGPRPTLATSLPHVALGILVLLALTSPRARQYATRRR